MSSFTPAELAEIVPDLRVLAANFSRGRHRDFLGEIDMRHAGHGMRFDPWRRRACSSFLWLWAKKRGGDKQEAIR